MKRSIFISCIVVSATAASSHAGTVYGFTQITSNGNANVASQLSVTVLSTGENANIGVGQVGFLFKNNVGTASSVKEIYFDGTGPLDSLVGVFNSAGTNFVGGSASPGNLPGGNSLSPAFVTSAGFLADSAGGPPLGLNQSSESTLIVYNLLGGKTYAHTIGAMTLGFANGADNDALRIGLHVTGIAQQGGGDTSESYVNTVVVPLPLTAYMGLSLLGSVGGVQLLRRLGRVRLEA